MKQAPPPEFEELKALFRPRWWRRLVGGMFMLAGAWFNVRLANGDVSMPVLFVLIGVALVMAVLTWARHARLLTWLMMHRKWSNRYSFWAAFGLPDDQDGPPALEWLAWAAGLLALAVYTVSFIRLFLT